MSIQQAYNSWSAIYDTNDNKTRDLDQRATIETLSKYHFDHVIELGCGTGKNTKWLLSKASKIIGIDFSDKMLAIAKEKINSNQVRFIKGDITKPWGIENQLVDLITSSLILEHIKDLAPVFRQANAKLNANGLFFISELHPFKQYSGSKAQFEMNGKMTNLEVFTHHLTDYINNAQSNGFVLLELKEWFDEENTVEIPRLISFVFQKKHND